MSTKFKTPREEDNEITGWIVAYPIAVAVAAWGFVWENYVWVQWPISYWQWFVLVIPILIAAYGCKLIAKINGFLGAVTIIAQVAKWLGLISLPLIHK